MGKTGEMSLMWSAKSTHHRACPAGVPRSGKDGAGHIPHHNGLPRRANHARGIQGADVPGRAVQQEVGTNMWPRRISAGRSQQGSRHGSTDRQGTLVTHWEILDQMVKRSTSQVMNRLRKQSCPVPLGTVGVSREYQAQVTVPLQHTHKPPQGKEKNPPVGHHRHRTWTTMEKLSRSPPT